MSKGWTIAVSIWMAFWAALAVLANVSATQGVSNIKSWVDMFGPSAAVHYLNGFNGPWMDMLARITTSAALFMGALYYIILAYDNRKAVEKFFFPNGWPFKGG